MLRLNGVKALPRQFHKHNYKQTLPNITTRLLTTAERNFHKRSNISKSSEAKSLVNNSQRDNEWIGSSLNDHKSEFESLSSLKVHHHNNKKFQELIDLGVFELGNLIKDRNFIAQFDNPQLIKQHSNAMVVIFEHLLTQAMKEYQLNKEESHEIITLEDLITPSIARLPYIIHEISTNENPLITRYFQLDTATATATDIESQTLTMFTKCFKSHVLKQSSLRSPSQKIKVDIRNPAEWYAKSRKFKRKLILHVGPTNSGKTFTALQRLKQAEFGYFAGPLRLLAREIYERFQTEGIRCNLITGEEIIHDTDEFGNTAGLSSGTIEMLNTSKVYDVVVLDEIQMIGDNERGWAWTNALLGANAKEVHLCGEASIVPLVERIAKLTGDEVIVNEYQRLGKLIVEEKPVQTVQELRRGDCIVVFSKKKILTYKTEIEKKTKLKCAVVYGALPAETRVVQASKFNNGEADVLIATDAIGMGLNLKINRIIFDHHTKFNGKANVPIETPQVKQIAGRAGRFKVAPSSTYGSKPEDPIQDMEETLNDARDTSIGYVTSFNGQSLKYVRDQLSLPSTQLQQGYIWPSDSIWAHYMSEFPRGTSFVDVIKRFSEEVDESRNFTIANTENRINMVGVFKNMKNSSNRMMISDQLRISTAPISTRLGNFENVIREFCEGISRSQSKTIFQYDSLNFSVLDVPVPVDPKECRLMLEEIETLHKYVMCWMWMNIRYPTLFVDREAAVDLKNSLEERIEDLIDNLKMANPSSSHNNRNRRSHLRRR
ncbi:hypothetical protein WICPIJ_007054 [Wickerhamomyces pijperi]|uniref:ATP-dependent RNA helicase SUV3, mitochondrial n=1 Tax=Wickerhamomyces pijperi TaxID=599730 RepID=A0A9P8Q0X5_WICPI|nr:hypothetical protein WICPIJ_007054 [Wickerhamomyces pijperi]